MYIFWDERYIFDIPLMMRGIYFIYLSWWEVYENLFTYIYIEKNLNLRYKYWYSSLTSLHRPSLCWSPPPRSRHQGGNTGSLLLLGTWRHSLLARQVHALPPSADTPGLRRQFWFCELTMGIWPLLLLAFMRDISVSVRGNCFQSPGISGRPRRKEREKVHWK